MGEQSAIAWTDATFNAWWGCSRVSPGCENCYAETFSARVGHGKRLPTIWGVDGERKAMSDEYWKGPLKWNQAAEKAGVRKRVFCSSMADVFEILPKRNAQGRAVQDCGRARLWPLIGATPYLDWLLLTKRPENVAQLAPWDEWPENVWIGTTAEDQRRADERTRHLIGIPAKVRFLSCEPMLEGVDLHALVKPSNPDGVHWVIVGGESGNGARAFDTGWARRIAWACRREGSALFVKQLGSNPHDGTARLGLRDSKGGDPLEWPEDLRVQEWPR